MIAGVSLCKDEADIIELSLRHMLAEGIDHIWLADGESTDGTREIIDSLAKETEAITCLTDTDRYVNQPGWITRLTHLAGDAGAEFIVPFDIDEFPYSTNGQTVAERITELGQSADVLFLRVYPHLNWQTRFVNPHGMHKVAFRYYPNVSVDWGAHGVSLPGGTWDVLDMRELQYRGFDHFLRKIDRAVNALSPSDMARGIGGHNTQYREMSEEQIRAAYDQLFNVPMVQDPVRTHLADPERFLL